MLLIILSYLNGIITMSVIVHLLLRHLPHGWRSLIALPAILYLYVGSEYVLYHLTKPLSDIYVYLCIMMIIRIIIMSIVFWTMIKKDDLNF